MTLVLLMLPVLLAAVLAISLSVSALAENAGRPEASAESTGRPGTTAESTAEDAESAWGGFSVEELPDYSEGSSSAGAQDGSAGTDSAGTEAEGSGVTEGTVAACSDAPDPVLPETTVTTSLRRYPRLPSAST